MTNDPSNWRGRLAECAAQHVPGTKAERTALLLLLLLALILRCWGFPSIPYTHDEISALVRVDFPSLGEAIGKGVVGVDTHPPGTHAFLWGWTQLFGFGDGAVKAPFILMSVLALFLLYRFAYAWTGGPTALIATSLLGCMQYTVMYGQIARPYAMGFFTTALLADQLTRYIGSGRGRHVVLIAIAAMLSAYTHHFAAMLAFFMVTTGLFLIVRSQRKGYLIACCAALMCYLPNLPLFFAQLRWKGLDEWLTPPEADWLVRYLWWIVHCSALFAIGAAILLIASLLLRLRQGASSRALLAITLVWGLLPLAIGYAYSVWRAPVLQYSVLLFSFPYVLIGGLAGLRHLRSPYGILCAGICSVLGTLTLIIDRHHFAVSGTSKYEDIVRGTIEAEKQGSLAVVDMPEEVMRFYRKLWCVNPSQAPNTNLRGMPVGALDSLLAVSTNNSMFYGQTTHAPPENVAKVASRYPFLTKRVDRVEGQSFWFQARPVNDPVKDTEMKALRTPQAIGGDDWKIDGSIALVTDTSHSPYPSLQRWDFTGHVYGALFERPVSELVRTGNDVIEVRADIERAAPESDLQVAVELKQGDSTYFYRAGELRLLPRNNGRTVLIAAVKLADIPGHGSGQLLRTYLINPEGRMAHVSALSVSVREGDPVLYGYFEPIEGIWKYR